MTPTIKPTSNPTGNPEVQEAVNVNSGKEEESLIDNEGAEPPNEVSFDFEADEESFSNSTSEWDEESFSNSTSEWDEELFSNSTSEFEDGLTGDSISQAYIVESNESISGSQTVSLRGLKAIVSGIFLLGVMQIF